MDSASAQTDSLLMFAAVKLRLLRAAPPLYRWMISIRTERERGMGARVCELPPPLCLCLCLFVLTLISFSPSSFPQIEAYVLVSVET